MPIEIKKTENSNGLIFHGDYPKDIIHAAGKPLLHPTTLILVVRLLKNGQLSIIPINKAPKVLKLEKCATTNKVYYDCLGGHIETVDFSNPPIPGVTLVDECTFRNGARRELSEELLLCARERSYTSELIFLHQIEYGPAAMPGGGVNHEVSDVFIYVLPDYIQDVHDDLIMRDDYMVNDKQIVCKFSVSEFSFVNLLNEYRKNPGIFMDGIGRILDYWINNNITENDLINVINGYKHIQIIIRP
jgi:hypothetical protein